MSVSDALGVYTNVCAATPAAVAPLAAPSVTEMVKLEAVYAMLLRLPPLPEKVRVAVTQDGDPRSIVPKRSEHVVEVTVMVSLPVAPALLLIDTTT